MRTIAVVMSLAIAGIALPADFTPAFATKMNGKCCQSSDGGRSARYHRVMSRRAIPHTCSAYAASCIRDSRCDRSITVKIAPLISFPQPYGETCAMKYLFTRLKCTSTSSQSPV